MGLTAGILIVLISIAHNVYGEKKQIPELKKITNDTVIIGSLRIMIFQGGIILLAVGVVQILTALNIVELIGFSQYFPIGIVFLNMLTSLIIILFKHQEILKVTIPQFIIFLIIIILQFFALN